MITLSTAPLWRLWIRCDWPASRVWLLPSNRSGGARRECQSYHNAVDLSCTAPPGTHSALNGQWLSLVSDSTVQLDHDGNAGRTASTRRVRTGFSSGAGATGGKPGGAASIGASSR